jgi:2-polyprenyl-6-methoxyphenol hydroxylase-like FAD-dependent oxidoreductase
MEAAVKVLIVGAGIAGLTLALCLRRHGHEVQIVERASELRDAGYMIDFFGSGYDAAERMGLLDDLEAIHYQIPRLSFVATTGRERFTIRYPTLRRRVFDNRHFNVMRGELERLLHDQLRRDVPIRFGTTVEVLREAGEHVSVQLSDGTSETAHLVAGADGVHSKIRRLVFGAPERFERFLGYHTAAAIVDPLPGAPGDAFSLLTELRRQVGIYPIRGGRMASFFVHAADRPLEDVSTAAAPRELRDAYGDLDWLVPDLLLRCERASEIYLDDVSQVELPAWSRGRVVLVGDACQCVSLLAGQGASMAMAGAYVLAEELGAGDDVAAALARYERRLRPSIERKQRAGRRIARWFVPDSELRLVVRDMALRASVWPLACEIVKRQIAGESIFRT